MVPRETVVAECQGLYGPFTLSERVVQKIWLRGDFLRARLVLADGRSLEIMQAGRWNLQGGPDFLGARLRIDGREMTGDVEVHFHAQDWTAHGHARNPAFSRVVLHVVLFPSDGRPVAAHSAGGDPLPTLVLLPFLHRDLEEYAADDALETWTAQDQWRGFEELASLSGSELNSLMRRHAHQRWAQKVRYARLRLERLGWNEAAHYTALEILGYRSNRTGMLAVAARHPLSEWSDGADAAGFYAEAREYWLVQGVRPANQPQKRLAQYADWCRANPRWPELLEQVSRTLPASLPWDGATGMVRRDGCLSHVRETWARVVMGTALSGSRVDTMICDGFLPLWAARSPADVSGVWFHWYPGDFPDQLHHVAKRLALGGVREQPFCHGFGQGLLGWLWARQLHASSWPVENLPNA